MLLPGLVWQGEDPRAARRKYGDNRVPLCLGDFSDRRPIHDHANLPLRLPFSLRGVRILVNEAGVGEQQLHLPRVKDSGEIFTTGRRGLAHIGGAYHSRRTPAISCGPPPGPPESRCFAGEQASEECSRADAPILGTASLFSPIRIVVDGGASGEVAAEEAAYQWSGRIHRALSGLAVEEGAGAVFAVEEITLDGLRDSRDRGALGNARFSLAVSERRFDQEMLAAIAAATPALDRGPEKEALFTPVGIMDHPRLRIPRKIRLMLGGDAVFVVRFTFGPAAVVACRGIHRKEERRKSGEAPRRYDQGRRCLRIVPSASMSCRRDWMSLHVGCRIVPRVLAARSCAMFPSRRSTWRLEVSIEAREILGLGESVHRSGHTAEAKAWRISASTRAAAWA